MFGANPFGWSYLAQGYAGSTGPAPGSPTNTVPPVITGPPTVGQTLSVTPGTWV